MRDSRCECLQKEINRLRSELHQLIDSENLASSVVQHRSRELDELILLYIRLKNQELNDP